VVEHLRGRSVLGENARGRRCGKDLMALSARPLDNLAADESGTTDDNDFHETSPLGACADGAR